MFSGFKLTPLALPPQPTPEDVDNFLRLVAKLTAGTVANRTVRVMAIETSEVPGDTFGTKLVRAVVSVCYAANEPMYLAECHVRVPGAPPYPSRYNFSTANLVQVTRLVMGERANKDVIRPSNTVNLAPSYGQGESLTHAIPHFPLDWLASLIEAILAAMFLATSFPHTVRLMG